MNPMSRSLPQISIIRVFSDHGDRPILGLFSASPRLRGETTPGFPIRGQVLPFPISAMTRDYGDPGDKRASRAPSPSPISPHSTPLTPHVTPLYPRLDVGLTP